MNIAARKRSALNRAPKHTSAQDYIIAGLIAVSSMCGAMGAISARDAAPVDHGKLYTLNFIDARGEAFAVDYDQSITDCLEQGYAMPGRPSFSCDIQAKGV